MYTYSRIETFTEEFSAEPLFALERKYLIRRVILALPKLCGMNVYAPKLCALFISLPDFYQECIKPECDLRSV